MMHKMKAALAAALITLAPAALAAGHYVTGVEGIQAASVPPPGVYYLGYLVDYNIGSVSGAPGNNTGTVTALANRAVWVTHAKILGADYGVEAIVPLQATSLTFGGIGIDSTSRGVGDVYVGPVVLGWHGSNWDGVFALGEWLDNGSYSSTDPSSIGLGYRSTMWTVGGTFYPDQARKWSASMLARFETNTSQKDTGVTPGDGLSIEWGIARQIAGGNQIGLVGYYQGQTGSNSGAGASRQKPRKSAVGLEWDVPLADHGLFLKFAGYKEFGSRGGATDGSLLRMTVVKAF